MPPKAKSRNGDPAAGSGARRLLASAGHGTDEDYGGGCYQMEDFGWAGDENLCGE